MPTAKAAPGSPTGLYKSVDGGQKWTKAGLPNAGRIGRIVVGVRPDDPPVGAQDEGTVDLEPLLQVLHRRYDGGVVARRGGEAGDLLVAHEVVEPRHRFDVVVDVIGSRFDDCAY